MRSRRYSISWLKTATQLSSAASTAWPSWWPQLGEARPWTLESRALRHRCSYLVGPFARNRCAAWGWKPYARSRSLDWVQRPLWRKSYVFGALSASRRHRRFCRFWRGVEGTFVPCGHCCKVSRRDASFLAWATTKSAWLSSRSLLVSSRWTPCSCCAGGRPPSMRHRAPAHPWDQGTMATPQSPRRAQTERVARRDRGQRRKRGGFLYTGCRLTKLWTMPPDGRLR
mmetsp:Transcript_31521/g.86813  ORF Transcript_31521/g.86813 Transcript_31521/m.86813 type:complete len:227 (-) Transcript_31521:1677-2357(-)